MSEPKHTAELAYRPNGDRDDWGFIRDPEGNLKLIVRGYTSARVETTDPYEEFGREVVRRYNAFPDLLEALKRRLPEWVYTEDYSDIPDHKIAAELTMGDLRTILAAIAKAQQEGGK